MLELPEVLVMSEQLKTAGGYKTVKRVLPPTKPHRFCWWRGEPSEYGERLAGQSVLTAEGFGIFVEIVFTNGLRLCVNDGVNLRLIKAADAPRDYQLLIEFTDGDALLFTVAMYGGIFLHKGDYDDGYYKKSRAYISPFAKEFEELYYSTLETSKQNLSVKAFLATEQRFPGIGNGVLQDILLVAGINPRRKLETLSAEDKKRLLDSVQRVLRVMTDKGGRDTEKDLFGKAGGYKTKMSKNTVAAGCPLCGGGIVKEPYLGGSVYYCASCQPLNKQ